MRTTPQAKLMDCDFFTVADPFNQSVTVDEARELIDELNVDIAADKTPANNIPLMPTGKW